MNKTSDSINNHKFLSMIFNSYSSNLNKDYKSELKRALLVSSRTDHITGSDKDKNE